MQTSITCSICKSDRIITDPECGEIICIDCGIVISDKIQDINQPEWRAFNTEQVNSKARTGAPTSLARHDMGLATMIGTADKDASGHRIDEAMHFRMKRLRTWDLRTQANTPRERNLLQAFYQLYILKDKLRLSDAAVEKTAYIYRKAQQTGFVRGRTIAAVLAAAVYITCRETEIGSPKSLKDVAAASNIKRKDLAKSYRQLVCEFDYKVPNIDPIKCIAKISSKANLSEKTARRAINIMRQVTENEISAGKDPMGLAAAVLYMSCIKTGENRTQKDISSAAGITEVTIRNRFKDFKNMLADLN